MGYYANGGGALRIKQEHFDEIVAACNRKFSWMNAENIEDVFSDWGYELDFVSGDIAWVWFPEGKLGHMEDFFEIIAPYTENGSMLDFTGEDGALWRSSFYNRKYYETGGVVTYPGDPYEAKVKTIC